MQPVTPAKNYYATHSDESLSALAALNAELSAQLQDVEAEAKQTEAQGRKKLKRLDRELAGLKRELALALEKNEELQLHQHQHASFVPSAAAALTSRHVAATATSSRSMITTPDRPTVSQDQDHQEEEEAEAERTPISRSLTSTRSKTRTPSPSPSLATVADDRSSQDIAQQLVSSVAELEAANARLARDKVALDAKVHRLQAELESLQSSYQSLEEYVSELEVESVKPRALLWEGGGAAAAAERRMLDWSADADAVRYLFFSSVTSSTLTDRLTRNCGQSTLTKVDQYTINGLLDQDTDYDHEFDTAAAAALSSWSPTPTPSRNHMARSLSAEMARSNLQPSTSRDQPTTRRRRRQLRISDVSSLNDANDSAEEKEKEEEEEEEEDEPIELLSLLHASDGTLPAEADYWPTDYAARYAPGMVLNRFAVRALTTALRWLVWVRFLVVLAFAVVAAVREGPRGLFVRSSASNGRRRLR